MANICLGQPAGIQQRRPEEVIRAGASGVAVITSILAFPDPKEEARKLKNAMLDVWQDGPPLVAPSILAQKAASPGKSEEVPTGIDKPDG